MIDEKDGQQQVVGVMGGLGPDATIDLFSRITELSKDRGASRDQDHLEVVISSVPQTPDRTESILHGDRGIVEYLQRSARRLEGAGADFIVIACNTAHFFLAEIQGAVSIPVVNMIHEAMASLARRNSGVESAGLLATTGTVRTGLYQDMGASQGISVIAPSEAIQRELVMEAIYGEGGIKAGGDPAAARAKLLDAARHLIENGAQALFAGCTEIPLVLAPGDVPAPLIDSTQVLAEVAVARGYGIDVRDVSPE